MFSKAECNERASTCLLLEEKLSPEEWFECHRKCQYELKSKQTGELQALVPLALREQINTTLRILLELKPSVPLPSKLSDRIEALQVLATVMEMNWKPRTTRQETSALTHRLLTLGWMPLVKLALDEHVIEMDELLNGIISHANLDVAVPELESLDDLLQSQTLPADLIKTSQEFTQVTRFLITRLRALLPLLRQLRVQIPSDFARLFLETIQSIAQSVTASCLGVRTRVSEFVPDEERLGILSKSHETKTRAQQQEWFDERVFGPLPFTSVQILEQFEEGSRICLQEFLPALEELYEKYSAIF